MTRPKPKKTESGIISINMGDVELRKRPNTKNWQCRYYYNGQRQEKTLRTPHQGAAVKMAIGIIADLKNGNDPFDKITPITFKDYVVEENGPFRKRWKRWGKDINKSQWSVAIRLATIWGPKNLHTITQRDCEKFLGGLLDAGRTEATANRYLMAMKVLFKKGIEWGYRKTDPTANIERFKEQENTPDYLTHQQVRTLYRLISDEYLPVVALAINTGMRMGEIQNLTWSNVSFEKKEIKVKDRKGKKGEDIPLHPSLARILEPRKRMSGYVCNRSQDLKDALRYPLRKVRRMAFISVARNQADDPNDPAFLAQLKENFKAEFNVQLSPQVLKAAISLGSPEDVTLPHLHPHLFRHTFATWLADAKATPGAIQQLLGHSTMVMPNRYAKATNHQKNEAIQSIPPDLLSDAGDDEK